MKLKIVDGPDQISLFRACQRVCDGKCDDEAKAKFRVVKESLLNDGAIHITSVPLDDFFISDIGHNDEELLTMVGSCAVVSKHRRLILRHRFHINSYNPYTCQGDIEIESFDELPTPAQIS